MAAKVTVKLTKSLIARSEKQIKTANSLKLFKIGDSSVHERNAVLEGKLAVIGHMVEVTE